MTIYSNNNKSCWVGSDYVFGVIPLTLSPQPDKKLFSTNGPM